MVENFRTSLDEHKVFLRQWLLLSGLATFLKKTPRVWILHDSKKN